MLKGVIYARYSCDKQTEQSIEGQLRVCEDYAKKNDILILGTYIDKATTGTNANRAEFQKMIADSKKKEWDYVLVYKLDRFSRDKYASVVYRKTLKDNGVKLLSAMENIPDSPEGIILESLLEAMNQYFSMELAQKVKRGMRETRLKGLWQGGTMPYGYKAENRKVVIVEEQAEVVRYIFEQYARGVYVRNIINDLTAKGIYHNRTVFAYNTVYGILKNEKYSGSYMLRDEVVDNIYPQIISPELYKKVRTKIEKNKHGKKSVKVVYLLRQKMKCGYCGESIVAESATGKNGKLNYYYKCGGRKNLKNGCKKTIIRKNDLENLIIKNIIEELQKPNTINTITAWLIEYQDNLISANSSLQILLKEQIQVENSLKNLVTALENGIMTNTTVKRLKELEERQQELERLIVVERSKTEVKVPKEEIKSFYQDGLDLEPLMIINYFIKEIILFDDKVEIIFNNPINNSPDNSRGFLFSKKQVKLPKYSSNGCAIIGHIDIRIEMTI